MRRRLAFLSGICLFVFLLPLSPAQAHQYLDPDCTRYSVPVTLSALDSTVYHVATWLCSRGSSEGKTIQVLVHGATYDHNYWDFPTSPQTYSYVKPILDAGYAVLNIDRIGTGESDHPPSLQVSILSNAFVLHQLVQSLRNGSVNGVSFSKIILVGHSFGSATVITEAFEFGDADGLIITGVMHTLNATGAAAVLTSFYPASQDPKFAQSGLPAGYLTSIPGTRVSSFYNMADAETSVTQQDEALKQTITDTELTTAFAGLSPTDTLLIHVPVLVAVGEKDVTVCGLLLSCATSTAIRNREVAFYAPDTCLEGYSLPSAGHSMNLHLNANQWFQAAINWSNRRIGSSVTQPPTQPCR